MALNQIALDSNKNIIYNPKPLAIRQGEKGIVLPVVLTAKNIGVKDLGNVVLNFEATKPDSKIILDEHQDHFKKSDGYFEYSLPSEVYQATGEVKGHFILKYSGDVVDTTSDFSIKVLSRTGQDEKSSDYISAAETIVEESKQKLQQIIDVVADATDQIDLTKTNLTSDVTKFLGDTQSTVNSNIKTLTNDLNTLKNTFTTNIQSAEGVFNSKKSEIDEWFTAKQRDYTSQKQTIDSEWDAKKSEKDNDWLKLKASYDNKIADLTKQYQQSVDQQKSKLSDDLANFKKQLQSQLDSTQTTINQLKTTDVPAISKKLDDIRADIERIDLDSVKVKADNAYTMASDTAKKVDGFDSRVNAKADKSELSSKANQSDLNALGGRVTTAESDIKKLDSSKMNSTYTYYRFQIDDKDLAMKNQAVAEAKTYTDSKSSLEILTEDQAQAMSDSKSAKLGTFYAMNSNGIQGLALGDVDGSFSTVVGYMVALPSGTNLYSGVLQLGNSKQSGTMLLKDNLSKCKNGVLFKIETYNYSGTRRDVPLFDEAELPNIEFWDEPISSSSSKSTTFIKVPKEYIFNNQTIVLKISKPSNPTKNNFFGSSQLPILTQIKLQDSVVEYSIPYMPNIYSYYKILSITTY